MLPCVALKFLSQRLMERINKGKKASAFENRAREKQREPQ